MTRPVDLDTVLAQVVLPISKIEGFEVGQSIPLAGTTVGSVVLTGPGGKAVASARLGQFAGKRAVRIKPEVAELQEADALPIAEPPVVPDMASDPPTPSAADGDATPPPST